MFRPRRLLSTCQRPLVERFGLAVAALRLIEQAEIVDGCKSVRMLRPQRLLVARQRPFIV